jgi:hypothetical protein
MNRYGSIVKKPHLIWLCLIPALFTACSNRAVLSSSASSQPILQLAHVQPVPLLSTIQTAAGAGRIESIVPLQQQGNAIRQVLIFIDGEVHLIALDGSAQRRITLPHPCDVHDQLAVTRDGQWLLCPFGSIMQVASLLPHAQESVHSLSLDGDQSVTYLSPAWSPDGRHLAFIRADQQGCALAIAAAQPPYTALALTALLTSDQFVQMDSGPVSHL